MVGHDQVRLNTASLDVTYAWLMKLIEATLVGPIHIY
jgi:hypothetical protein